MTDHRGLIESARAAVEACQPHMSARDHLPDSTKWADRERWDAVHLTLADDVPGLASLVARLATALEQQATAFSIEVTAQCDYVRETTAAALRLVAERDELVVLQDSLRGRLAAAERRVAETRGHYDAVREQVIALARDLAAARRERDENFEILTRQSEAIGQGARDLAAAKRQLEEATTCTARQALVLEQQESLTENFKNGERNLGIALREAWQQRDAAESRVAALEKLAVENNWTYVPVELVARAEAAERRAAELSVCGSWHCSGHRQCALERAVVDAAIAWHYAGLVDPLDDAVADLMEFREARTAAALRALEGQR